MPTVFGQSAGGSVIKSIQKGQTTIAAASASNTATITSVDTDKSVLIFSSTAGTNDVTELARGVITNATTLTFTRVGTTGATIVEWQVVEYN